MMKTTDKAKLALFDRLIDALAAAEGALRAITGIPARLSEDDLEDLEAEGETTRGVLK